MRLMFTTVLLAMAHAMRGILGATAGVPVKELRRPMRRLSLRRAARGPILEPSPAFLIAAHLWVSRRVLVAKREAKYDLMDLFARSLAVYCWITRQEGFEGLTMSFWRWKATVHLALSERERQKTALSFGFDYYRGATGTQILHNGKWRPVPAGGAGITRAASISPLYYAKVAGGLPILQDLSVFPGNIFFVDSGTTVQGGDTAGFGSHPDKPLLTVDFAIGLCTTTQADFVFVLPGHAEDIASGETIDLDVAGVSVVGRGRGPSRPTFTYDHASSTWDIGASGCTVSNMVLVPSVAVVTVGIDVETLFTDTLLEDIEAVPGEAGDGTDEFETCIELKVGCTRTTILGFNYSHHASANGATEAVHVNGISDRVRIEDFWIEITGAAAVAGILFTGVSTRSLIKNGVITTDAEPGIQGDGANTGSLVDVLIFSNLATIDAATVLTGMAHFNVRYVEVGNEAGTGVKTESVDD